MSDPFPRYPHAVLVGLLAIRKVQEEAAKMPPEMRRELAKALHLTATYIELQTQIDAVQE